MMCSTDNSHLSKLRNVSVRELRERLRNLITRGVQLSDSQGRGRVRLVTILQYLDPVPMAGEIHMFSVRDLVADTLTTHEKLHILDLYHLLGQCPPEAKVAPSGWLAAKSSTFSLFRWTTTCWPRTKISKC